MWIILNTEIIPSIKSDHCAVTLEFQEVETRVRGKGYWKINSFILDEEEYIKQLQANKTRLHKSRSSRSELEFDLSNFV